MIETLVSKREAIAVSYVQMRRYHFFGWFYVSLGLIVIAKVFFFLSEISQMYVKWSGNSKA